MFIERLPKELLDISEGFDDIDNVKTYGRYVVVAWCVPKNCLSEKLGSFRRRLCLGNIDFECFLSQVRFHFPGSVVPETSSFPDGYFSDSTSSTMDHSSGSSVPQVVEQLLWVALIKFSSSPPRGLERFIISPERSPAFFVKRKLGVSCSNWLLHWQNWMSDYAVEGVVHGSRIYCDDVGNSPSKGWRSKSSPSSSYSRLKGSGAVRSKFFSQRDELCQSRCDHGSQVDVRFAGRDAFQVLSAKVRGLEQRLRYLEDTLLDITSRGS